MIQTMEESSDAAIGYAVIGEVGEADYQTLVPAVQAAIDKSGSVNLLFDLTQFKWEKVDAWKSDIDFGSIPSYVRSEEQHRIAVPEREAMER